MPAAGRGRGEVGRDAGAAAFWQDHPSCWDHRMAVSDGGCHACWWREPGLGGQPDPVLPGAVVQPQWASLNLSVLV